MRWDCGESGTKRGWEEERVCVCKREDVCKAKK